MESADELTTQKEAQRRRAFAARKAEPDKEIASRQAIENLRSIERYQTANGILWYVDARSELRTQWFLPHAVASSKLIVVPYCTERNGEPSLGLWRIESMKELVRGKWNILEPPRERWDEPERHVTRTELDAIIVPGVAFSRDGRRLGNGLGYYDRLLSEVRSDCALIGICYTSQLFDDLTVNEQDVPMDYIVTETQVYEGGKPLLGV